MKRFIEKIKIHLWYDWRILKAKKKLMDVTLEYNNTGTLENELVYHICRAYFYDLCYHKMMYLEELN